MLLFLYFSAPSPMTPLPISVFYLSPLRWPHDLDQSLPPTPTRKTPLTPTVPHSIKVAGTPTTQAPWKGELVCLDPFDPWAKEIFPKAIGSKHGKLGVSLCLDLRSILV